MNRLLLERMEGAERPPRIDISEVRSWLSAHRGGWSFQEIAALGVSVTEVFDKGRVVISEHAERLAIREHLVYLGEGVDALIRVRPPETRGGPFRVEVIR